MQLEKIHVFNYSTVTSLMLVFIYLLVYLIFAWVDFQILIRRNENRTFRETANANLNKIFVKQARAQLV